MTAGQDSSTGDDPGDRDSGRAAPGLAGAGRDASGRDAPERDGLRRSTRLLFVLGILAGLNSATLLILDQPEQLSLASDVYYHAGTAILEGGDLYAVTPPDLPGYHYIYPPIVVVLFLPHALLGGEAAAYALQTVLNVAAAIGIAVVLRRALERRGVYLGRGDWLLLLAFTLLSAWSANQFVMGQVNLWLALAIALGLDWLDRDWMRPEADRRDDATDSDDRNRSSDGDGSADENEPAHEWRPARIGHASKAGLAFALAALVKLFPATLGLWLLRTRRYRAAGVAIATGLGGLLLGALALGPELTVEYLTDVLVDRFEGQTFEGTPDPSRNHTTVRRMLAAAFGGGSPVVTPLAFALVVPPVAYCYRDVSADRRRQTAVLATLVGTLLIMPLQPLYFSFLYFPAVVLACTMTAGRPRQLLLAGILLTLTSIGPETAEQLAGPLPSGLGTALVDAADAAFTVILPPTIGMWLLLAACVLCHAGRPSVEPGEK